MSSYIIVVDDEASVREVVKVFLEAKGYEVSVAEDGLDALRQIALRKPDLIVLDVMMSPITGWEVLEVLRGNEDLRDIRVIMLTGLNQERAEAQCWHLGCDWYQVKQKPLQFEDFGLVIDRLLAVDTIVPDPML